jgi:hypothetical protein
MVNLYKGALQELIGVFDALNDSDVDQALSMLADAKKLLFLVEVVKNYKSWDLRCVFTTWALT